MAFEGDPHRTLGVTPGASLNEIRSAYRRLAKQYHPDAAGERALPRFLAIQAAYERLVDGEGRLRPPGSRPTGGGGAPGSEPWRADPGRARASRDAWRARRSGPWTADGSGPGARPAGGAGAGDARSGGGNPAGGQAGGHPTGGATAPGGRAAGGDAPRGNAPGGGPAGGAPPGGASAGDRSHTRRGPRKATPGSTTYDEATGTPRDPEWSGGAWYGPSSGTYWTINPREYADPRKHGPEYLARARRATGDPRDGDPRAGDPRAGVDPGATGDRDATGDARPGGDDRRGGAGQRSAGGPGAADDEAGRWAWGGAGPTTTGGSAAEWGTHSWTYDPDAGGGTAWTQAASGRAGRPGFARPVAPEPEPPPLPDLESLARRASPESLLALARGQDRRWRLLVALVAWPPIGYALATLVATPTGCDRFSATCPEPVPILLLLAQPLVIAGLFLAPALAAVAAFASLVALTVALPVAAVLAVGSLPDARAGAPVLAVLTSIGYAAAFVGAAMRLWRPRDGDP